MTCAVRVNADIKPYFNPHEREARDALGSYTFPSRAILIHTSVKLVTGTQFAHPTLFTILIHTSVKLVTRVLSFLGSSVKYFNPHEREARDECLDFLI